MGFTLSTTKGKVFATKKVKHLSIFVDSALKYGILVKRISYLGLIINLINLLDYSYKVFPTHYL